ncbi:MAG: hypothetical protein JWQ63_2830 [Mucilaginibacter sp.]|nr:hypothetical protein [Mucilaginibacter sp.]
MNKVYIIIVNYNSFRETIECLESVLKSEYSNFQIFVVDNSSDNLSIDNLSNWISNNDYDKINTNFKHLVFPLENKPLNHAIVSETEFSNSEELYESTITIVRAKNNGFAAANNIVLNYLLKNESDSYLVWILNNDTVVEKDTLHNLVDFYQQNKDKRLILGSKLRYYNKPEVLQAIAGYYNIWIGKHSHIGNGENDLGQYDNYETGKKNYIVGASIFLPKIFLQQVGAMCEDYFLYFEELDWIQSAIKKGFKMAIVPNALIYHKEGSSIIEFKEKKKNTSIAEYYSIINRVRFIKKWYPYCLITVIPGVVFALIKRIMIGRFDLVKKTTMGIFKILLTK